MARTLVGLWLLSVLAAGCARPEGTHLAPSTRSRNQGEADGTRDLIKPPRAIATH